MVLDKITGDILLNEHFFAVIDNITIRCSAVSFPFGQIEKVISEAKLN